MKNKVVAMILAGGKGTRLKSLTKKNAKPAVGFAAKYRIIDFPLTNCAISKISTVGVATQYESTQLDSYLGSGDKWGYNGVHSLLTSLAPKLTEDGGHFYEGTADAVVQNLEWIENQGADYVLILSGDHIYLMDYQPMIKLHIDNDADLTVSCIEVDPKEAPRFGIVEADKENRFVGFEEKPAKPKSNLASMGVYLFSFKALKNYLLSDLKDEKSEHDFGKNIIPKMLSDNKKIMAYQFKDYWRDVGTVASLHAANMDLLDINNKLMTDLFYKTTHLFTEDKYSVPQYIGPQGSVVNCLSNQGAIILGSVKECVISHNAIIEEGAVCEKCVIMDDAYVGKNAKVYNAIIAPKAKIADGSVINKDSKEVILVD